MAGVWLEESRRLGWNKGCTIRWGTGWHVRLCKGAVLLYFQAFYKSTSASLAGCGLGETKWLLWSMSDVFLFHIRKKTFIRILITWGWQISFWRPLDRHRLPCCFFKPTTLPTQLWPPIFRLHPPTHTHYVKLHPLSVPTIQHLSLSRGITVGHQRPKCFTNKCTMIFT